MHVQNMAYAHAYGRQMQCASRARAPADCLCDVMTKAAMPAVHISCADLLSTHTWLAYWTAMLRMPCRPEAPVHRVGRRSTHRR